MENNRFRNRQMLGKRGEDVALEYLLRRGLKLLARNWRCGHKELDLVMEDEEFIRIVEVRSREYPSLIEPVESITAPKRRRIISAAKGFIAQMRKTQVEDAQVEDAQVGKAQVEDAQMGKAQMGQAQIEKAQIEKAQKGMARKPQGRKEVVFDVVQVLFNGELFEVKYIKDAFMPSW